MAVSIEIIRKTVDFDLASGYITYIPTREMNL